MYQGVSDGAHRKPRIFSYHTRKSGVNLARKQGMDAGSFTIIIDTREQTPWTFEAETVRATLHTGDYSVQGLEHSVAIERKSLADLVGSLTAGRDRFLRECDRLMSYRYKAIVVEGTVEDVWGKAYRSTVSPKSVLASTLAITCDRGVPVVWSGNRTHAQRSAEWLLKRAWAKRVDLGLTQQDIALEVSYA